MRFRVIQLNEARPLGLVVLPEEFHHDTNDETVVGGPHGQFFGRRCSIFTLRTRFARRRSVGTGSRCRGHYQGASGLADRPFFLRGSDSVT